MSSSGGGMVDGMQIFDNRASNGSGLFGKRGVGGIVDRGGAEAIAVPSAQVAPFFALMKRGPREAMISNTGAVPAPP
ncbi:hypothetical protein AWC23_13630 [Mycobacterium saskatchewanense]|uniref:Uncharacterized protein n=1 Tax=Mycobacterium saskatchewanense TaxID=220927 RepID=A0AAJ3TV61_9MYCO|nr:hypothetical protein AWC23_13630 [Mycobacterium saskatchewanense]